MNEALQAKPTVVRKKSANKSLTAPFTEGLQEYTGAWDTPQVVHLLKRMLFGARQQDIAYYKTRSLAETVDELLQAASIPSGFPLNNYSDNGTQIQPGLLPGKPG